MVSFVLLHTKLLIGMFWNQPLRMNVHALACLCALCLCCGASQHADFTLVQIVCLNTKWCVWLGALASREQTVFTLKWSGVPGSYESGKKEQSPSQEQCETTTLPYVIQVE